MGELTITDHRLKPIADKVLAGERLAFDDGITLYRSPDLLAVGWLANHVREKKHGDVTYFNVNRHINPTNICVAHCKLCAFGRDPSAPGAYNFSLEEIYARAEQGAREGALEFHIVGGLHPDLPFEYFLEMIRGLKQRCPGVHLKAFTMVEVGYFARIAKLSTKETLLKLKEAGVDSLPGGCAGLSATTRSAGRCGSTSRGRLMRSACTPTRQCSTGTLKQKRNASTISSSCASCRMKRMGSWRLFRWRFIRTTPRSRTFRSRRATPTCATSRYRGCCSTISNTSRRTGSCFRRASRRSRCASGPTT